MAGAVFVLLVSGLAGALIYGQQSLVNAGQRERATLLAQEGLEAARNLRGQGFAQLATGTYGVALEGGRWALAGSADEVDGRYTRTVQVQSVDSSTKEIISTVVWQQSPQRVGTVALRERLTAWSRRSWLATTTADFSAAMRAAVSAVAVGDGAFKLQSLGDWRLTKVVATGNTDGAGDAQDVIVVGDMAYVVGNTTTGANVTAFDIADLAHGNLPRVAAATVAGNISAVVTDGTYLYLATAMDAKELVVLRLSDLQEVNSLDLPTTADATDIALNSGRLYISRISNADRELHSVRIDNPDPLAVLSVAGSYEMGANVNGIAVAGTYVYLATGLDSAELRILQKSDLTAAGTIDLSTIQDATDVAVDGSFAYVTRVTSSQPELHKVNVATPASPSDVGSTQMVGNAWGVSAPGDGRVYVASSDATNKLYAIDAATMTILGGGGVAASGNAALGIYFWGNYVFLAGANDASELQVVRGTDGWERPVRIGSANLPTTANARAVAVQGNFAYVGTATNASGAEFFIYDISNPSAPQARGSVDFSATLIYDIAVSGSMAYLATGANDGEVIAVNVSNPDSPAETGRYNAPGTADAQAALISGTTLFIGSSGNGAGPEIYSFDISGNTLNRQGGIEAGGSFDLRIAGTTLYSATSFSGDELQIVDAANPAAMQLLSSISVTPNTAQAYGLAVEGDRLYVVTDAGGTNPDFYIYDISTPTTPSLLGSADLTTVNRGVVVSGTTAFVAGGSSGLRGLTVVDASNAAAPVVQGLGDLGSGAFAVALAGSRPVLSALNSALELQIFDPAQVDSQLARNGLWTSAPIDSGQAGTAWSGLSWVNSGSGSFAVQLRSSADGNTWTVWQGPTGAADYYTSSGSALNPQVTDGSGDQWLQVRAYLSGDMSASPVVEQMQIEY